MVLLENNRSHQISLQSLGVRVLVISYHLSLEDVLSICKALQSPSKSLPTPGLHALPGCYQASYERPLSVFAPVITGSQTQHKEPNDEQIVRHSLFLFPIKKTKKFRA